MTFAQVFDPLFRVPLANGFLLALVLPLLGAYVRLRNEWLAALGLAQVTAAGGVMAILVGVHPLAGSLGAAVVAAALKGRTERSGNDVYAVLLFFGWSAALLGAANSTRGEELSHSLLEGQLYFTTWANLGAALALVAVVAAGGAWLSKRLLLEHFFPESLAANGASPWKLHLAFDLLVAFSVALATESIGVMATFALVFLPPWVAFRIAGSWKRALVHCAGFSLTAYLAAFVLAIVLDQPFGPMLVGALVAGSLVLLPFRARR